MLGVAPDDRGLLPDADVARLAALGEAIQARFGPAVNVANHHVPTDSNTAAALDNDADTFWTAPDGFHTAALEVTLTRAATVDRALTMEWLTEGQAVQRYRIEAWTGEGAAAHWQTLVEAEAIGHKKIDTFAPVTATRFRLHVLTAAGTARIRESQLFAQTK